MRERDVPEGTEAVAGLSQCTDTKTSVTMMYGLEVTVTKCRDLPPYGTAGKGAVHAGCGCWCKPAWCKDIKVRLAPFHPKRSPFLWARVKARAIPYFFRVVMISMISMYMGTSCWFLAVVRDHGIDGVSYWQIVSSMIDCNFPVIQFSQHFVYVVDYSTTVVADRLFSSKRLYAPKIFYFAVCLLWHTSFLVRVTDGSSP